MRQISIKMWRTAYLRRHKNNCIEIVPLRLSVTSLPLLLLLDWGYWLHSKSRAIVWHSQTFEDSLHWRLVVSFSHLMKREWLEFWQEIYHLISWHKDAILLKDQKLWNSRGCTETQVAELYEWSHSSQTISLHYEYTKISACEEIPVTPYQSLLYSISN